MRFGSHSVPFRVVVSGVSLVGLGLAAALPTIANELTRNGIDPIITQSTTKVDASEPTHTTLPDALEVEPVDEPRQILPQAPEASMGAVAPVSASQAVAQSDMDPIVSPAMTDARAGSEFAMAESAIDQPAVVDEPNDTSLTSSLAGEASGGSGIVLALDHARVMRLVGDVNTIIIGNPAIADVSMPDPSTLVLTGKSYGETNMVMLDDAGNVLAEQTLRVTVRGQSLVSVYRGVQRTTLSCSPTCEIRPTPGDTPELVDAGLGAFQARNQAALEAVRGGE